jgi:RNA polymerase sigma-70 factor (ECF subfamily)
MTAAEEVPASGTWRDEQQLILEAKAGSPRAFQCLVERHMKQTYNIAFGFVGDHDAAEDITQEVFVKVHRTLSSFRGESEFSTWLYRITTNLSINHMRRHRKIRERTVEMNDALVTHAPSDDYHAESADQRAYVERVLHELPTLQRAVVILRHLDGLSTRQVSTILHCSEGTVKTHLFRGLKKMRNRLSFLQENRT